MSFIEILLSAVSLSMDAFAASLTIGACLEKASKRAAGRVAAACGGFQFLMPLAGWLLGAGVLVYIARYDHWVACVLLCIVGGNMIRESFAEEDACSPSDPSCGTPLLTVAVATSIDALAVGIGFAAVRAPVLSLAVSAGIITAGSCFAGVLLGGRAGGRLGRKMARVGGVVLCLIGLNILRAHLSV